VARKKKVPSLECFLKSVAQRDLDAFRGGKQFRRWWRYPLSSLRRLLMLGEALGARLSWREAAKP